MMRVLKRDNTYEPISFDKVLRRIRNLCQNLKGVSADEISQKVCARIYDGVKTSELDELAAQLCASLLTTHPDYGFLASRIIISNHHKNTSPSFSETMGLLFNAKDIHGVQNALISQELWDIVKTHKSKLNSVIDYQRDFLFDYFGFKTLERSYLLKVDGKIVERPQHMWMRVALGIHGNDIKEALETYEHMSQRYFTHATPTLFNAGTPRAQLASCFLLGSHDSITGIFKTVTDSAQISKYAGGIGIHIHDIRATGSHIRGTNGNSTGIIPMLRVFNNTARYVNQGGKRNGSIAMYLEPWHADIEAFLDIRKNHGSEEDRCRDLFTAMWIPDLFMKRVQENGDWSLMCPDESRGLSDAVGEEFEALYQKYEAEGKFRKKIKAQQLWMAILKYQIETGTPYLCYKDAANKKSNQKNLGTIKSSNLCVAPETKILTNEGYQEIRTLENKEVTVWNGVEWSKTTVQKTNESAELIRITFSEGSVLECTPYHKFHIQVGYNKNKTIIKKANELEPSDKLIKWSPPEAIIFTETEDIQHPYTHGLFCADGTYHLAYNGIDKRPSITLYGEKKLLINYLEIRSSSFNEDANGRINVQLPYDLAEKYKVPMKGSIQNRLDWLAGVIDGDGHTQYNPDNANQITICIGSIHLSFLQNIRYMLHSLGVSSVINLLSVEGDKMMPDGKGGTKEYYCQTCYRICISALGVSTLIKLGLNTHRIKLDNHEDVKQDNRHYVTIQSIEKTGRKDATYCFNEPKRHMGIFNGVITGNCSEIIEYSNNTSYSTCNLASIALPTYVEYEEETGIPFYNFKKLHQIAQMITRNINKVIDRTFYPVPETETNNKQHRPIGMGVQGLANTFALMRMPFDSPEAAQLNKDIFETIYHGALTASMLIAKRREEMRIELDIPGIVLKRKRELLKYLQMIPEETALTKYRGAYSSFEGSPASQGLLQFDLWEQSPGAVLWNWEELKGDIAKYGLRNSLLLAPMPTASTSQIMGFNESIEPFTSNIYQRQTLAGEFVIINKHLIKDLLDAGLWNTEMKNRIFTAGGSIQAIEDIPENIRALYKTAWEMKQKVLIDQAADRGIYVCQSQSLNLFVEDPEFSKLSNMHFYGWKRGLKTGVYYLRTRPRAKITAFTIEPPKLAQSISALALSATSNILPNTILAPLQIETPTEEQIMACSRDNPEGCLMCGS
jgi:ribonucleoside-diphosphate reductase alpha chain